MPELRHALPLPRSEHLIRLRGIEDFGENTPPLPGGLTPIVVVVSEAVVVVANRLRLRGDDDDDNDDDMAAKPPRHRVPLPSGGGRTACGSMNEFAYLGKDALSRSDFSPVELSSRVVDYPMGGINYGYPGELYRPLCQAGLDRSDS